MIKRNLLVTTTCAIAVLFAAAGIYAMTVPDVITLKPPAGEKQKKGPVIFHHKKHEAEYAKEFPDVYKNGCGECHHDKNNKPLTNLKEGDEVQKCIVCHKIPGERPKGKKLDKKERLKYLAEAFHYNCKDCHKAYNKKYRPSRDKKAPTTCSKCHEKKKK